MKKFISVTVLAIIWLPSFSAGPTGWDKLRIGMDKAAVTSLTKTDGIYLVDPLTAVKSIKMPESSGVEIYESRAAIPIGRDAVKVYLAFDQNKLTRIEFSLSEAPGYLKIISNQIIEKYGRPKEKEEYEIYSCRSKNGGEYPKMSGWASQEWVTQTQNGEKIKTLLLTTSIGCPGDILELESSGLSIFLENAQSNAKPGNKF